MKASDLEQNISNIKTSQHSVKNVEATFARIKKRRKQAAG